MDKVELFKKLANYNNEQQKSDFVDVDKFKGDYDCLRLETGRCWCGLKKGLGLKHKFIQVRENGGIVYSWNPGPSAAAIAEEVEKYKKENNVYGCKATIKFIKIYGLK
jgi:hypothetical protein